MSTVSPVLTLHNSHHLTTRDITSVRITFATPFKWWVLCHVVMSMSCPYKFEGCCTRPKSCMRNLQVPAVKLTLSRHWNDRSDSQLRNHAKTSIAYLCLNHRFVHRLFRRSKWSTCGPLRCPHCRSSEVKRLWIGSGGLFCVSLCELLREARCLNTLWGPRMLWYNSVHMLCNLWLVLKTQHIILYFIARNGSTHTDSIISSTTRSFVAHNICEELLVIALYEQLELGHIWLEMLRMLDFTCQNRSTYGKITTQIPRFNVASILYEQQLELCISTTASGSVVQTVLTFHHPWKSRVCWYSFWLPPSISKGDILWLERDHAHFPLDCLTWSVLDGVLLVPSLTSEVW